MLQGRLQLSPVYSCFSCKYRVDLCRGRNIVVRCSFSLRWKAVSYRRAIKESGNCCNDNLHWRFFRLRIVSCGRFFGWSFLPNSFVLENSHELRLSMERLTSLPSLARQRACRWIGKHPRFACGKIAWERPHSATDYTHLYPSFFF